MPDYFHFIGISLKAGRTLNESDTATAEKAVIVNEAFVKDYLADAANPLGQRVYIGKMFSFEQPWRIVRVVANVEGRQPPGGTREAGTLEDSDDAYALLSPYARGAG
jgi:hypothetical protein